MSAPTNLYKILDAPPPSPLPETLPTTPLDAKDGFIHLSLAEQTPITAKRHFSAYEALWILKLRPAALDGEVKYDTDTNAGVPKGCAHVHGSQKGLGKDNVVEVIEVKKAAGTEWTNVDELHKLEA